jgi:hypothetical protein
MVVDADDRGSEGKRGAELAAASEDPIAAAWRSWLLALATDADAAVAASLAYESLPPEARDAWLEALAQEAPSIAVPPVALYAPLLAVECDPARRARIEAAIDPRARLPGAAPKARAWRGVAEGGLHACVVVAPLYLNFVQVLTCKYRPARGFVAVHHDPLRHFGDVPDTHEVDGLSLEPTPLAVVVDELAHAIVADRRENREAPQAISSFVHLFGLERASD